MELQVIRDTYTALSTTGKLYVNGAFLVYTLEPRADQSQGKPFCIPEGRYLVELLMSDHFHFVTPHIMNVPDFTAIEIHNGNFPRDSHGCTIVGESRGIDFVGLSDVGFNALMMRLNPAAQIGEQIWITYSRMVYTAATTVSGPPAQIVVDPEIDG